MRAGGRAGSQGLQGRLDDGIYLLLWYKDHLFGRVKGMQNLSSKTVYSPGKSFVNRWDLVKSNA
jgi:hypothetical protein